MNEIVYKSAKGNPVTNSLLVASKFEKDHKNVIQGIKSLLLTAENSAVKNMFAETHYHNSRNQKQPMYVMNRDGFSLLVMGFTGEKALNFKIDFIEAFNKMETAMKSLDPANLTKLEILQMAIESENKAIALEAENKSLKPRAEFADRCLDTENKVDIGQAAKLLKLPFGRNTFFKVLRQKGIFFKNRNEPRQEYIERGYFELRQHLVPTEHHGDLSVTKVLVNQNGLFWLSKQFGSNFKEGIPALKVS